MCIDNWIKFYCHLFLEITPCPSSASGQWPTTAPGSIQLRPCPEGFTGKV